LLSLAAWVPAWADVMSFSDQHSGLHVDIQQSTPISLDAQFSCSPRELLALVGPSGSGKSTLLRAIAGIFKAERCNVVVDGEVWNSHQNAIHLPTHHRKVGMVFQSYALFPHMNILDNIATAIVHRSKTHRQQLASALLEKVNLSGLESRKPSELSGGQQQRVAVARALAREPNVLLLDEPFTAVDKITRRRLYREIIMLRRELKIPVVLVTHDLDEAAMLADTMVVLHKGRTLQSGTPDDITTRPASAELARLVDIRNVFDATVTHYDANANRTYLTWAGITIEAIGKPPIDSHHDVKWSIPDGSVVVQRTDRPSSSALQNTITGKVEDVLYAGHYAQISLHPDCNQLLTLYASVPRRIARLNYLGRGSKISVSLTPGDIHIMK